MVLQTTLRQCGTDPQIKFEASDHGDVVLAGLTKLRDMEQLFDVVLIVENVRLPAHRVVLASCSEYFRAMFTDGLVECQLDEISLNGVTATGMRNIIDFAYSSKIVINSENVEHVLCAANHIQILPVVEACVNYLKSHISLSNCIDMVSIAELFTLNDLRAYVYKYISRNFLSLSISLEFLKLSPSQLERLLQLNYPVDCTECDVLSAVIGWIVYHHGHSVPHALTYLSKINFKNISAEELDNMHNMSEFTKMLDDPTDGQKLQSFINIIHSSSAITVSGLTNMRGYEESLVLCGGFQPGSGMINDIQYYDKSNGAIKYLTTVPHVEQCNVGLAVVNNRLYVIGGAYNDEVLEEIIHGYGFCYNPMKHKWDNIAPMRDERCRFYLGSVENKLYAIGGDPSASLESIESARCECYDPETNSWSTIAPLPGNRMEHAGTTLDGTLYISGGQQDTEGPAFNTFFKYDPKADRWTQLPSMLSARADHTMFSYSGKIYVIGGCHEDENTHIRVMASTLDCFDLDKGEWEIVTEVPNPRLYATYTVHQRKIVVVGGWLHGDYQRKCKTILTFDFDTGRWTDAPEETQQIWEHASCSLYLPICKQN